MIILAALAAYVATCARLARDLVEDSKRRRTRQGGLLW